MGGIEGEAKLISNVSACILPCGETFTGKADIRKFKSRSSFGDRP